MRYRKKPVVIEAWEFPSYTKTAYRYPDWLVDAMRDGRAELHGNGLMIKTLEGDMQAARGDWIIRGIKGEIYPCKPDIFEATYEAVTD